MITHKINSCSLLSRTHIYLKALEIDPKEVKAYFRKAQAEAGQREFEQAKKTLAQAIKIDSTNKTLRQEYEK